jgi:hypothetical protein
MRNKNILLASAVIVIAISSAFSSQSLVLRDAYIEVQLFQSGPWLCVDSGVDCEDTGPATCMVAVPTMVGLKVVRGKLVNTNCIVPLNHYTTTPQLSPITGVYDAR